MAKYDITYSCGHSATIQLYGKTEEREKKIKWLESEGFCPECYKKYQREEAARKAAEILEAAGITFPELTGTEKQIEYAKNLRNAYIADEGKEIIFYAENDKLLKDHHDELSTAFKVFDSALKIYNTKCDLIRIALHETDAGTVITALRDGGKDTWHICEKFYNDIQKAMARLAENQNESK